MALRVNPTIPINLTPEKVLEFNTGILHASSSGIMTLTFQYWIKTSSILPKFTQDLQEAGYNVIYFTPFSTKAVWTRLYHSQPISNTITSRLNETATPTFPSLALSISTSPAPVTPPNHNYPSNSNAPLQPQDSDHCADAPEA